MQRAVNQDRGIGGNWNMRARAKILAYRYSFFCFSLYPFPCSLPIPYHCKPIALFLSPYDFQFYLDNLQQFSLTKVTCLRDLDIPNYTFTVTPVLVFSCETGEHTQPTSQPGRVVMQLLRFNLRQGYFILEDLNWSSGSAS